ncbi:GtrA family protein [Vibrio mangrovi]|uniref:GtrA family protein n=1 Tax=Vibrio mangrovi TaxID=474394 RepID=A0A1Y6IMQ2_9VIBR|nr:GtrA family protein [Vibrio mangrovi]MDW6004266.1 GtrA family protein [Vibrio mangrovi]SMR98935.1 GtrA-like protein [Vibrio mangrovi]
MNPSKNALWQNSLFDAEFRQKIRFALAGLINTGTSYITFVILYWLSEHYIPASILSYLIGMVFSFILNRRFVFKSAARSGQLLPFCLVNLSSLACSTGMLYLLVDGLEMFVYLAQVIAICTSMIINYLGYRAVFSHRRKNDE